MMTKINPFTGQEMEILSCDEVRAEAEAAGVADTNVLTIMRKFFGDGQDFAWADNARKSIAKWASPKRPVGTVEKHGLTILEVRGDG